MTRANQWLVFSSAFSVGAGFLGGMMFSRRRAPAGDSPSGRMFRLGEDLFVDEAALAHLRVRADMLANEGPLVRLRFNDRWLHFIWFHDAAIFPGQQGAVYALRQMGGDSMDARDDANARHFLQGLQKFGLLIDGGQWSDWKDLESKHLAKRSKEQIKPSTETTKIP